MLLGKPFPVLFWSQITKSIGGTFFIEETNIFVHLCGYIVIGRNMEVGKQFCLHPAVNGLHGSIVSRRTGSGHGSCNVIHGEKLIVALGGIDRTLVRMENEFLIRDLLGLEATYDRTVQYYHTLEGIPLGWSLDLLVPSDSGLAPETASQVYAGLFFTGKKHRLTVGAYLKKMDHLIFFKDATQLFSTAVAGWRDEIKTGTGNSKGIELLYELDLDRLEGKVAYTLSKTDRTFPEINEGKSFPAKFDRRHIVNVRLEYTVFSSKKKALGVNTFFTYQSGHWATVPSGQFSGWISPGEQEVVVDYHTGIHNWQAPAYIRWDIGAFFKYGLGTRRPGMLSVGIYNLLNRHNVYSIMYDPDSRSWKSLSLFPIMPTVSWSMEF